MSPILLRPIREQLEHDRVIRQLQTRWRRRFEVGINVGNEETVSVRSGDRTCFPDLVLTKIVGGRRLHGVVEVETAESVNHLEAMSEWSHFAKARGSFYLYVPAGFTDVALRLCQGARINVTEIWAYYAIDSQAKFSMSYRSPRARLQVKAAKLRAAQKPASARKTTGAKKAKAEKSGTKPIRAGTTAAGTAKGKKPARTKKAAKTFKPKKAAKVTRRAPLKRTAPKRARPKGAKKSTPSTAGVRRTGKTGAAPATKRRSKRSTTAKRKT